MTNESREAFEAWAVEQPRVAANEDCFAKSPYGAQRYEFGEVQSLWLSWQAALQWAASQQAAPAAWQWLNTGNFRKQLPKNAIREHWRPLVVAPTAQGERNA